MIRKRFSSIVAVAVSMIICLIMALPIVSFADDMDGLTGGGQQYSDQGGGQGGDESDVGAFGDYIQNYQPVDDEDMEKADYLASPLVNIIGTAVGVILALVAAGIFFVTACDLMYIAIPFTRPLLTSKMQLVSDEALACAPGGQTQGGMQGGMGSPMGGMGGMGSPMGGMGGMGGMGSPMGGMGSPMGGMNGMGGQPSVKSAISMYFKKRVVFIVVFTIAAILLTSSAITGVGINLAALLFKVIDKINGLINGVNV